MLMRYVVLLTFFLSLSACQRQDSTVEAPSKPEDHVVDQNLPESAVVEVRPLAELEAQLGVTNIMEGSILRDGTIILRRPTGQNSPLTGEWVEKDGSRFCNGYMTRVEGEDFCVSEIPEDWVPFEFDGQTYFVQPLADGSEH